MGPVPLLLLAPQLRHVSCVKRAYCAQRRVNDVLAASTARLTLQHHAAHARGAALVRVASSLGTSRPPRRMDSQASVWSARTRGDELGERGRGAGQPPAEQRDVVQRARGRSLAVHGDVCHPHRLQTCSVAVLRSCLLHLSLHHWSVTCMKACCSAVACLRCGIMHVKDMGYYACVCMLPPCRLNAGVTCAHLGDHNLFDPYGVPYKLWTLE